MRVKDNIDKLRETVPANVKIVAVSKFHSNDEILEAYSDGQLLFGESRVQELTEKHRHFPKISSGILWAVCNAIK